MHLQLVRLFKGNKAFVVTKVKLYLHGQLVQRFYLPFKVLDREFCAFGLNKSKLESVLRNLCGIYTARQLNWLRELKGDFS